MNTNIPTTEELTQLGDSEETKEFTLPNGNTYFINKFIDPTRAFIYLWTPDQREDSDPYPIFETDDPTKMIEYINNL